MIRRGFWLTVGAVTGIYGYRRVSAVGRRLSGSLNQGSLNQGSLKPAAPEQAALTQSARLARQGRRTAIRAARETYRFTRDVREGLDLYNARPAAGPTLSTDRESTDRESTTHEPEDGH